MLSSHKIDGDFYGQCSQIQQIDSKRIAIHLAILLFIVPSYEYFFLKQYPKLYNRLRMEPQKFPKSLKLSLLIEASELFLLHQRF